ncbi:MULTISPECIES: hypothetical protein [unclassified Nocardia]|uniref:hypothetical protein n=1 Tax=unclassified Nocardia TaxID=2637762 RepID=UPI001CE4B458|nr:MULTISPECIES: hypothetical protein [unclassified Nocardia]
MLKSYKELSDRWYTPLEPEPAAPMGPHPTEATTAAPVDRGGPARFPNYIREDDAAHTEVPTDLPARRAEFTGGWSDWIGHAPGPDDDYAAPREGGLVRFPWPDDDDDPVAADPLPSGPTRALRQEARSRPAARRLRVLVVLIVTLVLFAAAAAGVVFLLTSGKPRATGIAPATMQFAAGSAPADLAPGALPGSCPTERSDGVVRSAEAGGTDSGPDAILAFQYAYYVTRSGAKAREVVAPGASVSPAEVIQRGIDTYPAGTTHCVRIMTVSDNKYSVEVTVYRPGGEPTTYNRQIVTTGVIGGRTLITGIAAG